MKIRKTLLWLILAGVLALGLVPGTSTAALAISKTYTVNIDSDIAHGTVTASPNNMVTKGNSVTLTVTPDTGYQLKTSSFAVKQLKTPKKVSDIATAIGNAEFTGFFGQSQAKIKADGESLVVTLVDNSDPRDTLSGDVALVDADGDNHTCETNRYKYTFAFDKGGLSAIELKDTSSTTSFTSGSKIYLTEGESISLSGTGEEYSFTMPKGDVIVLAAFEPKPVSYQKATVDDETHKVTFGEETCNDYTFVTADIEKFEGGKWYVVNGAIENANRIEVSGDAHLILMDGGENNTNTLTLPAGIHVPEGSSLTIYGQSNQTGALTIGGVEENNAGIGGNVDDDGGTITINGGKINVTGGKNGAGIGSGSTGNGGSYANNGGEITINGGTVNATGGRWAAGIGGGNVGNGGKVTINGGDVTATGGVYGAGIGGGWTCDGGEVTVNGGTVVTSGSEETVLGNKQITMGIGGGYKDGGTGNGKLILGTDMYLYASDEKANPGKDSELEDNIPEENNNYRRLRYMDINNRKPDTKYNVTVKNTVSGTVTADPTRTWAGEPVTLTAAPEQGYVLTDLKAESIGVPETVADIIAVMGNSEYTSKETWKVKVGGKNTLLFYVGSYLMDELEPEKELTGSNGVYSCISGPNEHTSWVEGNKWTFKFDAEGYLTSIALHNNEDPTMPGKSESPLRKPVTLTQNPEDANEYTFTMPTGNVEVSATFDPPHIHGEGEDAIKFTKWTDTLARQQNGTAATAANSLPSVPGSYYLDKDVTLSKTWEAPQNGSNGVTSLCLNGNTVKLAKDSNDYNVMDVRSGRTLNIYDEDDKQGKITGGRQYGIYNYNGTINLYGGTISDNEQSGICNYGGTLEMYGGTITRNSNREQGGGVCNTGTSGTFHMHGGVITGNNVQLNNGYGKGGGVFVQSETTFTVDGSAQIYGNTAGTGDEAVENNVCVDYYHKENNDPRIGIIEVTGPLNDDAKISVCMVKREISTEYVLLKIGYVPGVFTSSTGDVKAKDYIGKFYSDSSDYDVLKDGNELKLTKKASVYNVTMKVKDDVGGTVTADPDKAEEGKQTPITLNVKAKNGYELGSISAISIPRPKTVGDLFKALGTDSYITSDGTVIWFNSEEKRLQCNNNGVLYDYAPSNTTLTKTDKGGYACTGSASNPQSWIFTINDEGKVNINWANVNFGDSTGTLAETVNLTYVTTEEKTVKYQFTMPDADVVVKAEFYEIHQHHVGESDIIFDTRWTKTDSLPGSAGDYYLTEDITLSGGWTAPEGTTNLCLNGHTIDGKNGDFSVITVPANATLNVYNEEEIIGSITGGKGTTYRTGDHDAKRGGGVLVENQGVFNLYGGKITGNDLTFTGGSNGGGVAVDAGGEFNMHGGEISGNTVNRPADYESGVGHGSAVMVSGGGTFNMKGGTISGNHGYHGAVSLLGAATANIEGGTITRNNENQAIHTNDQSGKFNLTISGGTIDGNGKYAITLQGDAGDSFTLTGKPTITDTVKLDGETKIATVIKDDTVQYSGSAITVEMKTPGVFTTGWKFENDNQAKAVFTSADPKYIVTATADKQAQLVVEPIPYLEWSNTQLVLNKDEDACKNYEVVTAETTTLEAGKWYVVKGTTPVNVPNRINVTGEVHLILVDGATLNAQKGITVEGSNHLYIHGQSLDNSAGKLYANSTEKDNAGIGGNNTNNGGYITINGGTVRASVGERITGAGIGGGNGTSHSLITINGGTVEAYGGEKSAGIGGGKGGIGGEVIINGGTVTAFGQANSAGIGGGDSGNGGTVTINGGIVRAIGATGGAGIGGGYKADGGTVTVNGGTVYAISNYPGASGIGKGYSGNDDGALKVATSHVVYSNGSEMITEGNENNSQDIHQGEGAEKNLTNVTRMQYMLVKEGLAPIPYQKMSWDGSAVVTTDQRCEAYNVVTPETTTLGEEGKTTWYAVTKTPVNIEERVTVKGTVNLILVNNKTLTARKGITTTDATLNIYGQKQDTNTTPGSLQSSASGVAGCAGIGGEDGENGGTLNVHGGDIMGWGANDAAGIGGGKGGDGGTVTVYSGTVKNQITADKKSNAAGIGSGSNGSSGGTVTVYGGTVIAHREKDGAAIDGSLYVATSHAVYSDDATINDTNKAQFKFQGKGVGVDNALNITRKQNMTIVEGEVKYPVWVEGTQVNGRNVENVLTGTDNDGKVSYDPNTNTLTLDGYTYTGAGAAVDDVAGLPPTGIVNTDANIPLTIELNGENSIGLEEGATSAIAIYSVGNLTFKGEGKLNATALGSGSHAIYASGILTFDSGEINATGDDSGIESENPVVIGEGITSLVSTGNEVAISGSGDGMVQNAVAGLGWTEPTVIQPSKEFEISVDGQSIDGCKKVAFPNTHVHNFVYATTATNAEGDTIIRKCVPTEEGSPCYFEEPTLTIVKPELDTYGGEGNAAATLVEANNFIQAAGLTPTLDELANTIVYYNATKTDEGYTKEGEPLIEAPKDPGHYVAEITVNGLKTSEGEGNSLTAFVGYTIAQGPANIVELPTASPIIKGDALADSELTGGEAKFGENTPIEGTFTWKNNDPYDVPKNEPDEMFDVVFTPSDPLYGPAEVKIPVKVFDVGVTGNENLPYNNTEQPLVSVDTSKLEGGKLMFAKGDENGPTGKFSETIPTAEEVGTYHVWYKVQGDGETGETRLHHVEAKIGTVDSKGSASAQTLPYTAQPQPLVKGGEAEGGHLEYALGNDDVTPPTEGWSTEVPTATEPGDYYVWYKVVPDKNHNPYGPACVKVTIDKPIVTPTEEPTPDVPEEVKPEPEQVSDYTLFATMKTSGKKALKLSWTKVPEAEGYDVFFGLCGQGDAPLYKSVSGQSLTVKKLKQKTAYKARVYAWKTVNGAKTYIGTSSPIVHTITGGSNKKYTNAKKISVKKKKLTVAAGKTVAIKTTLKKVKSSKKFLNHTSKVRYFSNNHDIASVSENGKVTGVSAGTCMVYAIAENGLRVGVQITVK